MNTEAISVPSLTRGQHSVGALAEESTGNTKMQLVSTPMEFGKQTNKLVLFPHVHLMNCSFHIFFYLQLPHLAQFFSQIIKKLSSSSSYSFQAEHPKRRKRQFINRTYGRDKRYLP